MKKYYQIGMAAIIIFLMITSAVAIYITHFEKKDEKVLTTFEGIDGLSCKSGILIDQKGKILFEKNKDERGHPASTTKILTALVALEIIGYIGSDITQYVTIPAEAVNVEGSSIYLKEGQKVIFEDLLYGAMLRSGNDAATAIACLAGGSLENFVKQMNKKAHELGCQNSHFMNPTGLVEDDHYSTVEDMAKITRAAMNNEEFRKIVGTKSYATKSPSLKKSIFINKNKTLLQYAGGNGVKIGYTTLAGRTLVSSAKRGNQEFIAVVFNDSNWFLDCYKLLDFGFNNCEAGGD